MCGRLTEERERSGGSVTYAYDTASNRIQMVATEASGQVCTTDYSYDIRNRLLTEIRRDGEITECYGYSYDYNGNQLQRRKERHEGARGRDNPGRVSFARPSEHGDAILEIRDYNVENQLIKLYRDTAVTTYRYRLDGLRHSKEMERVTTTHQWDGQEMVAEQINGSITARYLRGINLIAQEQDNRLQYYQYNAHGDVIERTDQGGATLKRYSYDVFGNEQNRDPLDINPFRYCGEYYNKEGAGYYLRARNYEPKVGRFTGKDTHWNTDNMIYGDGYPHTMVSAAANRQGSLGLNRYTYLPNNSATIQSGNRYVYCVNDPMRYSDKTGKLASTVIGGLVAGDYLAVFLHPFRAKILGMVYCQVQ